MIRELGHDDVVEVARLGDEPDERPPILDVIGSGETRLVVNTPSPRPGPVRDAAEIRHAAIAEGILCLTSVDTAVAAARSLEPAVRERVFDVRPLDEWQPAASRSRVSA
jgi:carbamoyl-phosphate synthase large subunit